MTPLPILDLIAGMIFIYFLLAVINNSLFEIFASLFKLRAVLLKKWLLLTFQDSANELMNHPLLNGLTKKNKSTSYMNGKNFAKALCDILVSNSNAVQNQQVQGVQIPVISSANIYKAIESSELPAEVKKVLRFFITKTNADKLLDKEVKEMEHFERQITEWFDGAMERVGSNFKRKSGLFTVIFATIVVAFMNIDSLSLFNYLYSNPDARKSLAMASYSAASDTNYAKYVDVLKEKAEKADLDSASKDTTKQTLAQILTEMKSQKSTIDSTTATLESFIPIGWSQTDSKLWWTDGRFTLKKIGGLIITILAMCLGAPFWFDILGKVANLRSSIKPITEKSK